MLPVVSSLVFVFRSLGLAYQEVVIALIGEAHEGFRALRRFALALIVFVIAALSLIVWTPLSEVWFVTISGLSRELAGFALAPARIFAPIAGLTALLSFQRAVLVVRGTTKAITCATIIEVFGVVAVLWIAISRLDAVGAVAASTALLVGRIGANLYLAPAMRTQRWKVGTLER